MRRSIFGVMAIAMLLVLGLVAPSLADHQDNHTKESWTNDMNQASYWGEDCEKVLDEDADAYQLETSADTMIIKAGSTFVDVYSSPSLGLYTHTGQGSVSWVILCGVDDEPEVNPCDPADRPAGMSIGQWMDQLEAEDDDFNRADCFEYDVTDVCGSLDASVLDHPEFAIGDYRFRWLEGDAKAVAPDTDGEDGDNAMPASFEEGEGDGSVEVTYYIVGPEGDYLTSTDLPNWWDNPVTVTVNTDCEEPGEETPPEETPEEEAPEEEPAEEAPAEEAPEETVTEEAPEETVTEETEEEPVTEVTRTTPTRIDSGTGGLLPTTGGFGLLALMLAGMLLAGTGLSVLGRRR